jgi:hypothetical protein
LKDWLQASDYKSRTWETNREQYDRQQDAADAWKPPTTLSGTPTATARTVERAHQTENRPKRRRENPLRIVSDESSADDADNSLPPSTLSPISRYSPSQVAATSASCSREAGAGSSLLQPSVAAALPSSPPSLSPMFMPDESTRPLSGSTAALARPELQAQPLASHASRRKEAPFFPPRRVGRSEKKKLRATLNTRCCVNCLISGHRVQDCPFPVPYPVGIARPPPENLLVPLQAFNVADWTAAARRSHPKLVIEEMYNSKIKSRLAKLEKAFEEEVTDAGLIVLRKLFHFHTVDPAIWSERFIVVRRLFDFLKLGTGAVHAERCRKFLGVRLFVCLFPVLLAMI